MLRSSFLTACILSTLGVLAGCHTSPDVAFDRCHADYQAFLQQIEYPDVEIPANAWHSEESATPPPTTRRLEQLEDWPLTLQEAIELALSNSEVIRQLGGRVVANPESTSTVFDPALVETDPIAGTEAALSAFDAQLDMHLYLQRRERKFNNFVLGGQTLSLGEQLGAFQAAISKTAATGTQFALENSTFYDRNDRGIPPNLFNSYYDTEFRAGFRHPLMRGGGIQFNRIAGPGARPGNYNGVLIARINSDVALVDFETAIRDLGANVERTYWLLHLAYRELDAVLEGRQAAQRTWEFKKRNNEVGQDVGDDEVAFARDQFYAAQVAVENKLSGTATLPGVYGRERELRSLLGLPASDGRLIRPITPPLTADVQFDWQESLNYSLIRRPELRKQRWLVKQRELELVAARNFRLPELNFVGQYSWSGFGDNLAGGGSTAFSDLVRGDLQGWVTGFELRTPIGNRRGHLAVRNAELQLRRARVILEEQERQMGFALREAFTELDRAYSVSRAAFNRADAAGEHLFELRKKVSRGDRTPLIVELEAQRRRVEAKVEFHRAIVDYNLAFSQIHYARGTLLDSLQVSLNEGPWSETAHISAAREAARFRPRHHAIGSLVPAPVSAGAYSQQLDSPTVASGTSGPPVDSGLAPAGDQLQRLPPANDTPAP
jgi:outer membrane protein TolC